MLTCSQFPTWLTAPSPPSRIVTAIPKHLNVSAQHQQLLSAGSGAVVRREAPQAEHKQPLEAAPSSGKSPRSSNLTERPTTPALLLLELQLNHPTSPKCIPISQLAHSQAGFREHVHEYRENGTSRAFNWAQAA